MQLICSSHSLDEQEPGGGPEAATSSVVCSAPYDVPVKAAAAIVRIVWVRVHLNGLEPAKDGFCVIPRTPRTVIVPPTA